MEAGQITVAVRGDVGPKDVRYARQKVARVTGWVGEPVLFARVKLTAAADPARERPALAEGVLDINGDVVRAHVAARRMDEAVDLLEERLREQLERHKDRRLAARKRGRGSAEPGEWRHGDAPTRRPPFFPRSVEERRVIRHQAFDPRPLAPAEAHEQMLRLDYDFYLFTDAVTGEDSVVFRHPAGGADLRSTSGPDHAPLLDDSEAAEHLDLAGAPFLFYRTTSSGRGTVMYRRYDGHYGVITAALSVPAEHGPPRSLPP
jgi:ribosome-associated translation inhibitor RaiA